MLNGMRWKEAAALAGPQYGLLAVWQAAPLGIGREVLARYAKDAGWRRACRGVYQLPGHHLTPLAQVKAAELALAGHGVACGTTAAFVWGLRRGLVRPLRFVVPPECSRQPQGTRTIRADWPLAPVVREGVLVTPADWTICSAALDVDVDDLARMIAAADRMRLCPRSQVRDLVESQPYMRRRRKVLEALGRQPLSHSELEALGRRRLREADLHPHDRPHLVLDGRGQRVAELDIAFVDEMVGIPIDGPHHLDPAQKRADEDQRHKLQLLGWHLIPADEHRLVHQPAVFIRQVREALRQPR
jgi:hypothetical protein